MTTNHKEEIIEERLKAWLSGDPSGVRHAALELFLHQKDLSIQDIYDQLSDTFPVTYHAVGGMVGLVSSRIGVLEGVRDDKAHCRLYCLKEKHRSSVKKMLTI
ncbi:MAG: DUF2551 domain-containing protein [Methanospirillum sp.]|nr:DUF2551 domain-containing protein [Methanospirillum sp.]